MKLRALREPRGGATGSAERGDPRAAGDPGADGEGPVRGPRLLWSLLGLGDRVEDLLARALAPAGLTPAKFRVLAELAGAPAGGLPLGELGRRVGRSAPDVTELAARLEAEGLIRRVRAEHDRRVVLAALTRRGRDLLRVAVPGVMEAERDVRRLLGDEGWRWLARAAERLQAAPPPTRAAAGERRGARVAG